MLIEIFLKNGETQLMEVRDGSIYEVFEQIDDFVGKDNYSHYLEVL